MAIEKRLRICPLCEATCGLEFEVEGREVLSIRGDAEDAFSEGYICPKGVALQDLDADPDRLRTPMMREGDTWREATWDEAFEDIARNLLPLIESHGKDALAVYLGNPSVHNAALAFYGPALLKILGTHSLFSASTLDQIPKQLAAAAMFGTGLSIPIPDIDRCMYMVIVGANPLESNGSLMTAPNFGERLKRLRARGGKLIVIDPRYTKTAKIADAHHFIRPGSDAYFLFGIVHTLFTEGLADPGRLAEFLNGLEDVEALAEPFSPEAVEERCGIPADVIREIAREIAAADGAAVYARIGASTQEFGTLANWLPDVIHALTGNLDEPGGAMFPKAAHGGGNTKGAPGVGKGFRMARRMSRVRNRPEIFGEFPTACLAEEIETPGEGQIRALITVAGNPILSSPNGRRLDAALESLDYMVSLDLYLNETTRHANVILPGLSPLETCQFDPAFAQLSIENHARFSPAMFEKPEGQLTEWETLLRLGGIFSGLGPNVDTDLIDTMVMTNVIQREIQLETSVVHGRTPDELLEALKPRRGPERMIDFMLRTGPYGEGFGADPDGLTLDKLEAHPHGIALGKLAPRIPEMLRTPSGKIELAPEIVTGDVPRLREALGRPSNGLLLVGRRHLRSNNSWMHNSPRLVKGKARCTLQIHPEDAAAQGLSDGSMATIASRVGSIEIPVEVTSEIMPGVVSIPHGWGHNAPGARLGVAAEYAGVNSNLLTDEEALDEPSGNAILCGIPVTVSPATFVESMDQEAVGVTK